MFNGLRRFGLRSSLNVIDGPPSSFFNREVLASELYEGTHYDLVAYGGAPDPDPGGTVTRDVDGNIVLTLSTTGANREVGISIKKLLGAPFFHARDIWVEMGLELGGTAVVTDLDMTGTGVTPSSNTRFGIRHYEEGYTPLDVDPRYGEALIHYYAASSFICSANRWDTAFIRGNAAAQADLNLHHCLCLGMPYITNTGVGSYSALSSAAWGSTAAGSKAVSIGAGTTGLNWDTPSETGDVRLYLNGGATTGLQNGTTLVATIKKLWISDIPGAIHP